VGAEYGAGKTYPIEFDTFLSNACLSVSFSVLNHKMDCDYIESILALEPGPLTYKYSVLKKEERNPFTSHTV